MVSVGGTSPSLSGALALLQRQRVVSALCSITLHVVGIGSCASVLVRQQVAPREIIRLTLLADRGGGTKGAAVSSAVPAHTAAPAAVEVVPVPASVKKPAAAISAKRPARRVEAAVAKPAVAVSQPVDSAASTSAATVGNGGFGAGRGAGAGSGAGSGRGTGDGSGTGGDGSRIQEYLATLRARIERSKRYPLLARRQGVEGRAAVAFEVTATGHVQHLRLAGTTHPLLGQAALNAVEGAAPFPQLPSDIAGPPLLVEIALRFALEEP